MSKKLLSLALAAMMMLACVGCGDKENNSSTPSSQGGGSSTPTSSTGSSTGGSESTPTDTTPVGGTVILGNTTELSGDFVWPAFGGSSAGAADLDVSNLTKGYSTMELDQDGVYQWNQIVVKDHSETEDADGNLVVTIEINPGLKFSDGTELKADNYLAYALAFSTAVARNAGHPGMAGQTYVGFDSFSKYIGDGAENYTDEKVPGKVTNEDGEEVDGEVDNEYYGATKEFSGIRKLGEYKFSYTVAAPDFYPYYFADTYGAVSPYPLEQVLGTGVEVKDDGNGCYLTEAWYEQGADSDPATKTYTFKKSEHLTTARYDSMSYPFSGPYMIKEWDSSTKQATLEINPEYQGNFEGQKPHVQTLVYIYIVEETQVDMLKNGEVDILSNVTGGELTNSALEAMNASNGKFTENHYQRAGYGKIEFECDFGPTSYQEVRQAVTYLLNRAEFCQTFTGGYGVVVDGPYSPDHAMWKAVEDEIDLIAYDYSPANAASVLEAAGWIYNSKGEPWTAGAGGVDTVRYKKLEGDYLTDVNKAYESVANTDGITYKTVEINGEYYIPLAINWFGISGNPVTDLLGTTLSNSSDLTAAGMVIRQTTGDFTTLLGNIYREPSYGYGGTPIYGMLNLATGWTTSIYDNAYNWSLDPIYFGYSNNKLFDEYDKAFPYYVDGKHTKLSLEEAKAASGDKLGMDYLSMAMVYDATTEDEYNEWWREFIERWNQLMPDIPLYSNYYYDVYNTKIQNYETGPFWGTAKALVYAYVAE